MKKTQVIILIEALIQTNKSIVCLLNSSLYSGIDPLARVALEHSINLLYILDDDSNNRSKEFMKNFIDETLKKSEQWHSYCCKVNDEIGKEVSKSKLNYFQEIKKVLILNYMKIMFQIGQRYIKDLSNVVKKVRIVLFMQ